MTVWVCTLCETGYASEALPRGPASTCPRCLSRGMFVPRPVEVHGGDPSRYAARTRRGPVSSDKLRSGLHAAAPLGPYGPHLGPLPADAFVFLYGPPGGGKSTLAHRLGIELARGGCRVLHASVEEGHGQSLQARLARLGRHRDLVVTDARTAFEIDDDLAALERAGNPARVLVVDSTTVLDADVATYRTWSTRGLGLITVCHETVDRKPRGGHELGHEADVIVRVDRLEATTTKNRYGPTPVTFPVLLPSEESR